MTNSALKKIRTGTELERFHASYFPVTESGCWIWMRSVDGDGYGVHYIQGRKMFAHRRSYELFVGAIDDGLFVCHRCDVPACVNPHHLFLGTCKENLHDAIRKKRFAVGEKNVKAKLTWDDVRFIRSTNLSTREAMLRFGVSKPTINQIKRGTIWKEQ